MSTTETITAPCNQPCKDCGLRPRRQRIVNLSTGPSISFSMSAPLYCRECAPARRDAAQARYDARLDAKLAASKDMHAAWLVWLDAKEQS